MKQWDKRFGGDGADWLTCFQQTKDGGYILAGSSGSGISGDKTQATQGGLDFWIVKIDSAGNKQWDKDFGGTLDDEPYSILQTTDGGYLLGGYSSSGIGGNKTQANWGIFDYWIVKIDSTGIKQWDKDIGGAAAEGLFSIQQTSDGGYMLGGCSDSGIGGDKTQPSRGGYDYWIVKIDSNGSKQWDKDFGGIGEETFFSVRQTIDGGFILGGTSNSGIGGDKTMPTWGNKDYWIVKIDSTGMKQWDKDLGGTASDEFHAMEQTTDAGYILGGLSSSGIGGDKTQVTWGGRDYWIVKVDSTGNKQWDKDFGGNTIEDDFGSVIQTNDGGYFLCGDSFSPISGDKTESNLGQSQAWVVKTDSLGNKEWDKTIFTDPELKVFPFAFQTKEGCYAIAEGSYAGIAGYRTQDNWDISYGSQDYWIVKFCDSSVILNAAFISPNSICPGTCIDFTNLSSNSTSYQWTFSGSSMTSSTDVNPTNICYANPGSYDVQLIASNANGSDTLLLSNYINVYPSPPPQAITQSDDTLFANAGATSYQWYFNGSQINGATNYFYIAPASGDYNLVATDGNGCEVEAAIFNVVAEIQTTIGNERFSIFPNPVLDKFTIHDAQFTPDSYRDGTANDISIYNLPGERIFLAVDCLPIAIGTLTVDCQPLPPGIYFLEIISDQNTFRTKFVKQ